MRRNALSSHSALERLNLKGHDFVMRAGLITQLATGGVLALVAASLAAGCAGGSAYGASNNGGGGGGMKSNCTVALPPAGTELIGVDLQSSASCNDNTYQLVQGFFGGTTVTASQVVSITHSAANMIQFKNFDTIAHTAADLGPWSGSYPSMGPDPSATPTPTGHDISEAGFTAGNLNPGVTSPNKYVANIPGVYVFGCAYHYLSNGMRTVIIVQ